MLRLFVFDPIGHGPHSFSVIAQTEEEARQLVQAHVDSAHTLAGQLNYEAKGWGTGGYIVTAFEPGEIAEHENS
jgi:hypothetical protein